MNKNSLWHIFLLGHTGQSQYCGSRCDEERAILYCDELKNELSDSSQWKGIYYSLAKEKTIRLPPSKFDLDKIKNEQRIALHEAGHAVAAIQLGVDGQDFGVITIVPKGQQNGSFSMNEMHSNIVDVQRDVVINCSGYGALHALGHPEDFACTGCEDDFDKSKILIDNWNLPSLNHWKNLATDFLSNAENSRAVRTVADSLIKHKELGPEYTQILVRIAIGLDTKDFLEKWKERHDLLDQSYWLI